MALYDTQTQKMTRSVFKRGRLDSVGNNLELIAKRMMDSDDLVKMLTRNTREALIDGRDVTEEEKVAALSDSILTIPMIDKDLDAKTTIIIQVGQIVPLGSGGTGFVISFDIICNYDYWELIGTAHRPLRIMQEIDALLGDTKGDTFGKFDFMGANPVLVDEKHGGFHLEYMYAQE